MVSLSLEGNLDQVDILSRFNNQPFHTPPLALTVADNALVRAFTGIKNLTIKTSNHPLPRTDIEKVRVGECGPDAAKAKVSVLLISLQYCVQGYETERDFFSDQA